MHAVCQEEYLSDLSDLLSAVGLDQMPGNTSEQWLE